MKDKIQKKLNDLYIEYRTNLPNKIEAIARLWQNQKKIWDLNQFTILHREVHSLCGSSGTYGYQELSKSARKLELLLKDILCRETFTDEEKINITKQITQLKSLLADESSQNETTLEKELSELGRNNIIYILDTDDILVNQLTENLKLLGYVPSFISDIITLRLAVINKSPVAVIMNTDLLDESGIQIIVDVQQELSVPFQLFCILPDDTLLPRLKAIRAGSHAFFQKPVDINNLTQIVHHKCSVVPDEPYRILIIDDSESLGKYYSLILGQAGMTAKALSDPLQLFREIDSFEPNLLLMDIYMPECTGFELAKILRQESSYTKIPIIFLSTEEDKEKKLFAISLGGDDFLTKPISPQHLISAVRARSKRASILNYYMTTDSLTGLLNHSSILKQLEIEISRVLQTQTRGAFVMIDIDHFKNINDTFGHLSGDLVIKKLSSLLLARLRSQDSVGRYGGEEFALILPGATLEDSQKIINQLRVQFSEIQFGSEDCAFFVTFSAGVSYFDSNSTATSIIEQADHSLYKAKNKGRNCVIAFGAK